MPFQDPEPKLKYSENNIFVMSHFGTVLLPELDCRVFLRKPTSTNFHLVFSGQILIVSGLISTAYKIENCCYIMIFQLTLIYYFFILYYLCFEAKTSWNYTNNI